MNGIASPWFEKAEYEARVARLQAALRAADLEGLVAFQPETVTWLTGFGVSCSVCKRRRIRAVQTRRDSGCIPSRATARASGAFASRATGAWCSDSRTAKPWMWT